MSSSKRKKNRQRRRQQQHSRVCVVCRQEGGQELPCRCRGSMGLHEGECSDNWYACYDEWTNGEAGSTFDARCVTCRGRFRLRCVRRFDPLRPLRLLEWAAHGIYDNLLDMVRVLVMLTLFAFAIFAFLVVLGYSHKLVIAVYVTLSWNGPESLPNVYAHNPVLIGLPEMPFSDLVDLFVRHFDYYPLGQMLDESTTSVQPICIRGSRGLSIDWGHFAIAIETVLVLLWVYVVLALSRMFVPALVRTFFFSTELTPASRNANKKRGAV